LSPHRFRGYFIHISVCSLILFGLPIFSFSQSAYSIHLHDSIHQVLKSKNLDRCQPVRPCGNPFERVFKKAEDNVLTAKADSITLTWNHWTDYTGKYYVLVASVFDDFLFLGEVDTNQYVLSLKPFKGEPVVQYKVIAENCTETQTRPIRLANK
jgi:hypothetical protein